MNRAPSTNGHAAESVRARGGYDAFFAPAEQVESAGAGGHAASAGSAAAQAGPRHEHGEPVIGAPRPPEANGSDRPPTTSGAVSPPSSAAQAPRPAAQNSADAAASSAQQDQARAYAQPQGSAQSQQSDRGRSSIQSQSGQDRSAQSQPAQAQPAQDRTGEVQSAQAQTGQAQSGQTQSAQTQSQSYAQARSSSETSSATWQSAEAQSETAAAPWRSAEATPETTGATGQPTTSWVPDRIERSSYEHARVEVLPAALTSADLLADIAAARRAQLKSQSGMRGALNKVGFNLGLSPAEQRVENRRGRIRRQLTSTYQIAVVSVKGGVGRTTVTAALGSTFASLRPDRVVAIDGNPDFGDLPSRTAPHPYGLTLRDLAQSQNLDAFSAVHSFTSINDSDLAVLASPWNTEATAALSGHEYAAAVEILRRHYNLLMVDCGTGVLDSVTGAVLHTSDAVVVVTPATVGGVKGAVATLNWLNSHGLQHLIAKSIVAIVHHQPAKPTVEVDQIEKLFASAQRPTQVVPYDPHLAEGGEIDLRLLDKDTLLAFEELAASLADGIPSHPGGGAPGDRGGWR
ncbi:MinD/ParA family ATP-binding protein [Nocardia wallacei]|uniref:MinD/ParA family ATP-binding protein n=1 Tax=Nocardia wallacei TaxID=480035 RepID=UPI0024558D5B|nr:MinD/ParA family protein [Nocardia wallacei]